jgi:hypothetical protein
MWLRPPTAHEVPVPAQQRLRRHDHPLPPRRRQEPSQRREERAIGCPERRPRLLPAKHHQLTAQNEQLDVLGELVATTAHEQPQQRRERDIPESEDHPSMLPRPAAADTKTRP